MLTYLLLDIEEQVRIVECKLRLIRERLHEAAFRKASGGAPEQNQCAETRILADQGHDQHRFQPGSQHRRLMREGRTFRQIGDRDRLPLTTRAAPPLLVERDSRRTHRLEET